MKTDLVVAGYLFHDSKILLIHHKKLDLWLPIGGHIETEETPDEALVREFKEEVGLDIEILNRNHLPIEGNTKKQLATPFLVNVHNVGDHDHCCFFYICEPKNPSALEVNTSELKGHDWFSIDDLGQNRVPADVKNIARKAFEMYNWSKSIL